MKSLKQTKLNICIISFFFLLILAILTAGAFAETAPDATGKINSSDGAILRKSASTSSAKVGGLADNTVITIHKEIFKSKTSTAKKNRWYYVTAGSKKGYVRADLVDSIKYSTVSGKVTYKLNYRKGAGTKMAKVGTFKKGAAVTVVLNATPVSSTKGSSIKWYKIKKGSKYYYVCAAKVKFSSTAAAAPSESSGDTETAADTVSSAKKDDFEKYLDSQGFPETYKKKLRTLHEAHPNWEFVAYKTGVAWSSALSKQTSGGTSLVSGVYGSSYRDGSKQYEKGWYKANSKVVAYYMDPRNFLTEDRICMFEDLSYKAKYQTATVVSAILSPTKLPGCGFTATIFVNAGKKCDVSPVFLASRARQETGGGSDAINGTKVLGKKVYNPFNIGAFGGTNPLYNGLLYAYAKGWTTPTKAVEGGAQELAKNYINQGQFTGYYQRFNVRNGASKVGTHQYMTNIMAPYSEAYSTKTSYSKYGILNQPLVFEIPIYEGMPSSTKLP